MKPFGLVSLCILALNINSCMTVSIGETITSLWRKAWSSSCEFSTDTSRSKRSIDFPNVHDPDEFYEYLYPSLKLKPEDAESGRGLFSSSWLDDFIEYWETECHTVDSEGEPLESAMNTSKKGSNDANTTSNYTSLFNSTNLQKMDKQILPILPTPSGPLAPIVEALFPPISYKPVDKFFASYGGDVEYFFPVWGWGIPFDGDITFLGFHGFKGLFPYRR